MWLHGQPNSQRSSQCSAVSHRAASFLPACQLDQVALPWSLALGSQQVHNFKASSEDVSLPHKAAGGLEAHCRSVASVTGADESEQKLLCAMGCSIWSAQGHPIRCAWLGTQLPFWERLLCCSRGRPCLRLLLGTLFLLVLLVQYDLFFLLITA